MNATSTTATMTADNTMVLPKRGRGRPRGILKKPLAPGAAPKPPKKTRDLPPLNDLPAWTISDFCIAYSMSRSLYYKEKRAGRGPKETRVGPTKILITRKDAADWLLKQRKQSA
jgi:hypothetical protein